MEEPSDNGIGPMQGMFEHYAQFFKGSHADADQEEAFLSKIKERIAAGNQTTVCLVCLEVVGPHDPIWQCSRSCYQTFHLVCIKEWARKNKSAAASKAESRLNPERFPDAAKQAIQSACWRCPLCQEGYAEVPSRYTCYCGKVEDPPYDPWVVPHSCGELCQLPLPCGHECVVQCHPGPCPVCPRMVESTCHCGAVTEVKRCGNHHFTCGGICGAQLPCGHSCKETCHEGDCPPCSVEGTYSCRCGRQQRQGVCSEQGWDCEQPCEKLLSCGVHHCSDGCHEGPCARCPLQDKTTCPCGKVTYSGLGCGTARASCGATCEKLLPCGVHSCMERCHEGPCPVTCREVVPRTCRCGKITRPVPCQQELRCEVRCTRMRNCGHHQCKRRCCDGNCPPCTEVCNRKLNCQNHRCRDTCHPGPCGLCRLQNSVTCACGETTYTLPCGAEKRAIPPRCRHNCPVKWPCRHREQIAEHRCHFGPCPPCPYQCATIRADCGHACTAPCHDPPPLALPPFQQPAPPQSFLMSAAVASKAATAGSGSSKGAGSGGAGSSGGATQAAMAGREEQLLQQDAPVALQVAAAAQEQWQELMVALPACPPCDALVAVPCLGGHLSSQQRCHDASAFSCGEPCGRPLGCGRHTCSKPCHVLQPDAHEGAASVSSTAHGSGRISGHGAGRPLPDMQPEPCEICSRPCEQARPCSHPCPLVCHSGDCPACTQGLSMACHCGKSLIEVECDEWHKGTVAWRTQQLSCGKPCHKARNGCPHFCTQPCHEGDCTQEACEEAVTVRCRCRRIKQKMPCHSVRVLLHDAGGDGSYDASTPLRLLACDPAGCCAASDSIPQSGGSARASGTAAAPVDQVAGGKQQLGPTQSASMASSLKSQHATEAPATATSVAVRASKPQASGAGGKAAAIRTGLQDTTPSPDAAGQGKDAGPGGVRQRKKSREERLREKDVAQALKEQKRVREQRLAMLLQVAALMVVAVGALVLGLWLRPELEHTS